MHPRLMELGCGVVVFRFVQGQRVHPGLMQGVVVFRCVRGHCMPPRHMILGCGGRVFRCVQGQCVHPALMNLGRGGWCLGAFRGTVCTPAL